MSNYVEYDDEIAFHPGYYLKEMVMESGLTQEDYAEQCGINLQKLEHLLNGNQSLTIDLAKRLADISGTSVAYWLNLQKRYDTLVERIYKTNWDSKKGCTFRIDNPKYEDLLFLKKMVEIRRKEMNSK